MSIEGNLEAVQLCFQFKAKIAVDFYGRTPLHYAAMYGHTDICTLLIDSGADIDQVDQDGNTPLMYAIISGHYETVNSLIEKGASFEPLPNSGIPLIIACQYGHLDIVKNLLSRGAKLIPNMDGLYPLHLACREGKTEITKCLIAHGSMIERKDSFTGWTPLFYAASEGHLDCIKVLLEANARIDLLDDSGWYAWTYALYRGHLEAGKLLEPKVLPTPETHAEMEPQILFSPSGLSSKTFSLAVDDAKRDVPNGGLSANSTAGDIDIDDIPSLSLPPPIIPLRI